MENVTVPLQNINQFPPAVLNEITANYVSNGRLDVNQLLRHTPNTHTDGNGIYFAQNYAYDLCLATFHQENSTNRLVEWSRSVNMDINIGQWLPVIHIRRYSMATPAPIEQRIPTPLNGLPSTSTNRRATRCRRTSNSRLEKLHTQAYVRLRPLHEVLRQLKIQKMRRKHGCDKELIICLRKGFNAKRSERDVNAANVTLKDLRISLVKCDRAGSSGVSSRS